MSASDPALAPVFNFNASSGTPVVFSSFSSKSSSSSSITPSELCARQIAPREPTLWLEPRILISFQRLTQQHIRAAPEFNAKLGVVVDGQRNELNDSCAQGAEQVCQGVHLRIFGRSLVAGSASAVMSTISTT